MSLLHAVEEFLNGMVFDPSVDVVAVRTVKHQVAWLEPTRDRTKGGGDVGSLRRDEVRISNRDGDELEVEAAAGLGRGTEREEPAAPN